MTTRPIRITKRDGTTAVVQGLRFEKDGSGTRVYGEDGGVILDFYDGVLGEIYYEDLFTFVQPAAEPTTPTDPTEEPETGDNEVIDEESLGNEAEE